VRGRSAPHGLLSVPERLYLEFIIGSAAMVAAALIEMIWGVAAERRPLEDIARPLTFAK
jgi:hypothetical protein